MPWYHRGEHSDGSWYKFFSTEAAALASIAKFLGRNHDSDGHPLRSGQRYVDAFGGTHRVSETTVPNARTMAAIERAYDAREGGTATKRQLALLHRHGY
jgi:hypothetical protein